jgi:arsenite methyltransferase
MSTETADTLREEVRVRYAEAARSVAAGTNASCGSGSCCAGEGASADFGKSRYTNEDRGELPAAAALASLGCGNPAAVADHHGGQVVKIQRARGGQDR